MTLYIFYTKGAQGHERLERLADSLSHDGHRIEVRMIDADSVEGSGLVQVYDVLARPAIVLAGPDGTPLQTWTDELPQAADILYRAGGF